MKSLFYALLLILVFTELNYAQNGGYAILFDGIDGKAVANMNTGNTNSTITMEFWFARVSDQAGQKYLADLHSISGLNRRRVMPYINNGEIGIEAYPNTGDDDNFIIVNTGVVPPLNIWTHIAVVINGASLKMYINGKEYANSSFAPASYQITGNEDLSIATNYWGATFANIEVDEMRIWSIDRSQVQINANMYKELVGNEAGLLSYYKMSDGAGVSISSNQSVGTYNATLNGGNTWITSGAFLGTKTGLYFDGLDSYVDCGNNAQVQFNGGQNFTLEAWVKPTAGQWGAIISKFQHHAAHEGYSLEMFSDRRIALLFGNNWSDWKSVNSTNSLTLNTWNHVAATYDGTTMKIYINGCLEGTYTYTDGCTDSGTPLVIGSRMGTTVFDTFFPGYIDEARVWAAALTEAQLRENMCKTLTGNEAGLRAYYRIDETAGSTTYDYTSYAANGTLTNMDVVNDWTASDAFNTWIGAESAGWSDSGNWTKGVPTSAQSVGIYKWALGADAKFSSTPTVRNCVISSTASPQLNSDINIEGNLCLEKNLDLNGYNITLSPTSYLLEGSGVLSGVAGTISITKNLASPASLDVGGLGLKISSTINLGSTTITRGHAVQSGNGNSSITRYYNITPTNNSSVNGTIVFPYLDSELNGLTENNFTLFRSTNNGTTWTNQGGTLSAANNTVTKSGISSFSRWTIGDVTLPLNEPVPAVLSAIEGTDLSYTEGSGAVQITNTITVSDGDDTNLESAVIQITGNYQNGEDELTFVNQNGITGSWNSTLGKLTLIGSATVANYQTALRAVKYNNSSNNPSAITRTVSFTVNDGDNNSNTLTRNITISILANNPSIVTNTGGNVNEGGTLVLSDVMLKANDEDGPVYSLTYRITKAPKHGTISASFTQNDIANGKVTYIHDGSEMPADTFKFVVKDADGNSTEENSFIITVNNVNDPPLFTGVPVYVMNEDEEFIITNSMLLEYVNDPDDPDSLLSIKLSSQNENINLSELDNSFHVNCSENWFGNASCIFTVSDGKVTIDTTVNITVNSVNDLPIFTGLPVSIEFKQTSSATIDLNGAASDVETPDSLLVFSFSSDPDSVKVSLNNETRIATILSVGKFIGDVLLTVKVTDESSGSDEGVINVTVNPDVTGMELLDGIPEDYVLFQNYPNPFNPITTIKFDIPKEGKHIIKVYNVIGEVAGVLADKEFAAGRYQVTFDASNLPSGIYFYQLIGNEKNFVKKMLLLK